MLISNSEIGEERTGRRRNKLQPNARVGWLNLEESPEWWRKKKNYITILHQKVIIMIIIQTRYKFILVLRSSILFMWICQTFQRKTELRARLLLPHISATPCTWERRSTPAAAAAVSPADIMSSEQKRLHCTRVEKAHALQLAHYDQGSSGYIHSEYTRDQIWDFTLWLSNRSVSWVSAPNMAKQSIHQDRWAVTQELLDCFPGKICLSHRGKPYSKCHLDGAKHLIEIKIMIISIQYGINVVTK